MHNPMPALTFKAYAGGGDYEYQQQQMVQAHDSSSLAHTVVHWLGDTVGWAPLIALLGLGLLAVFRKKVKTWLKD